MKILHFLVTDRLSGAENVVIDILNGFKESNEVYYVSPEGPIREAVEKNGINFIPCDTDSVSEIKRVYREIKPDIVHACDPRMSFKCALAGIPFVSQLHNNCPWMKKLCPNSLALWYTAKKAKAVITVSESIEKEFIFRKAFKGKLHMLENTVNREKVENGAKEPFDKKYDLVFVGRLNEQKRPLMFLELCRLIRRKLPEMSAVMVGEGELKGECEEYIKEYSVEGVTLHGFDPNPYKIINASKINVFTSHYEGFGLVAVESMILSKPVLAFPVGGLADVVTNESGALCDSIEEMSQEALKLLSDTEYYEKKSLGASENSRRFTDSDLYIEKIKNIYAEVLKK